MPRRLALFRPDTNRPLAQGTIGSRRQGLGFGASDVGLEVQRLGFWVLLWLWGLERCFAVFRGIAFQLPALPGTL